VFMGTPDFAVPTLELLIENGYEITAVYTQPDKEAGRGRHVAASPVKQVAVSRGIRVMQPDSLRGEGVVEELASLAPELVVVAAYGQILPRAVLSLPRFGCVNIHPSLLPKYRGSSPIASAIMHGDDATGVTVMLLDAGMDTGPLLKQAKVPISAEDTTGSLTAKLAQIGARLLLETLPQWLEGRITPQPQDEAQTSYTKQIAKEDGEMDWQLSAVELWRRVRAFDPWPGCYTRWKDKLLKIIQAVPVDGGEAGDVGMVIALPQPSPAPVGVITAGGILGLLRLQLEGKKEMAAAEFLRGQRDFIGSSLA
ncbi:MAG: methionyl-tRNA formyltransferase, partial [Chloroflexi bacterium]|nr:methionyl-tRNA formyltransferase [Chloroflexota bacterium]